MRSKVGSSENEIIINQGAIFPIINAVEFMEPGYDYGHYYKTMAEIENIKHFAMMIPACRLPPFPATRAKLTGQSVPNSAASECRY